MRGNLKKIIGWICGAPIYRFRGWTFEIPHYGGPWPVRKNGEPRKKAGRKFWKMYDEFDILSDSQKELFRAGGGCVPLYNKEEGTPVVVHFVLTRHWYAEMLAGRKDIEYREITPYWSSRLTRRKVTHAAFSCGYTARGRFVRPVTMIDIGPCPYRGWTGEFYRVHLGPIMQNPTGQPPPRLGGGSVAPGCWASESKGK